jgi:hypothetical protein
MNKPKINRGLVYAALALWLVIASCSWLNTASTGDTRTESQAIDLGTATEANVRIEMDAGKLEVEGGADELMQATFRYNVDEWEPQVEYSVNGSQGELVVNQPNAEVSLSGNQVNEWTLLFNEDTPLEFEINTGAGESVLDLSSLDLTGLQLETGAGNVEVNLGGAWERDINASIQAGVGAISVMLPGEMGARVTVDTGLGGVTASGLDRDGEAYVNQAFGSSPYTLTLVIRAGVGGVELTAP